MIRDGYRATTIPLRSTVKEEVCVSMDFEERSTVPHPMTIPHSTIPGERVCVCVSLGVQYNDVCALTVFYVIFCVR